MKIKKKKRISSGDKTYYALVNIGASILFLIVLYPLIFVVSASFSDASAVQAGKVFLWPVDVTFEGYLTVFKEADVFIGYYNSFRYMILGTLVNIVMTMAAGYALSRKETPLRGLWMFMFTFTMFFNGGLIPEYILMTKLDFVDSLWVMILPGAIMVWNLIITRTFLQHSIPKELLEVATIDGCNDTQYFFKIILPLSKAIIAVIALYYAVGHWNAYFRAFIYLNSRNLYPLQLFLREILVSSQIDLELITDPEIFEKKEGLADLLKYSLIVVATAPMLMVYPFAQKYFVKGVMIGSLKG